MWEWEWEWAVGVGRENDIHSACPSFLPSLRPSVRPSIHSVPINVCSYSFVCWLFDRSVGWFVRSSVRPFFLLSCLVAWVVGWFVRSFVRSFVLVSSSLFGHTHSFVRSCYTFRCCIRVLLPSFQLELTELAEFAAPCRAVLVRGAWCMLYSFTEG